MCRGSPTWRSSSASSPITASIHGRRQARRRHRGRGPAPCTSPRGEIVDTTAPYELVSRMRASFWVLAPLLARMGEARVSMPGGCAIGTRPVDLLIMAMEQLGADDRDRRRLCRRHGAGRSARRRDRFPEGHRRRHPHGADGGLARARARRVIENAAREPEIVDVADCLNKMGAQISGAGTVDAS